MAHVMLPCTLECLILAHGSEMFHMNRTARCGRRLSRAPQAAESTGSEPFGFPILVFHLLKLFSWCVSRETLTGNLVLLLRGAYFAHGSGPFVMAWVITFSPRVLRAWTSRGQWNVMRSFFKAAQVFKVSFPSFSPGKRLGG